MPTIRSLIIGPGAIGTLACAQAQQYGPVWAYAHRPNPILARLCLRTPEPIELNWQLLGDADKRIDLIWVCCKAYHAQASTEVLLTRFPKAVAILLHNGMGPQHQLALQFPGRLIWGTTTCGALRVDPLTYRQTGYGTSHLGLPPEQTEQTEQTEQSLAAALLTRLATWQGPLGLAVSDRIESLLWQKLMINAVINPLTAVQQMPNRHVLQPEFADEMDGLCREIGQIMSHLGLPPISNPVRLVQQTAALSADNRSSMAEDIRTGRATEIDYIIGFLLRSARPFRLATPFLTKWYKQIAQVSKS
ncbi:ketopantoate reductase family protein [Reinekea sp.]|uniref:ketopantoate reductase family protein n=1 Tax=Reinekea sp. TaxID=1970455 RepID=UPI002A7EBE72|nr:ketopantoate reductase C-terminal domain-containing protein [Reinekea sp.]